MASDWFKPLRRVAATVPGVTARTIVFGGDRPQSRAEVNVVPLEGFPAALSRFDTQTAVIVGSEGVPVLEYRPPGR